MNRKILLLAAGLLAAPALTMSVLSQTTPADAPATAPAASQPATQAVTTAAPQSLTDAIAKGIDLLTAGKIKETIELLAPPDDVNREKANGNFDKMVDQFKTEGTDAKLLTALKAAQTLSPKLSDDGKSASYPKLNDDTPPLEFTKINDTWYLKN